MKKWLPVLSLLICCMIWGTTFVAVKNVSSKIDPFLLSTLRNGIAVVILLPVILLSKKVSCLKNKTAMKNGAILGIILASIYVIQTIGLQFTSSTHSAFITSSAVIMVPLMFMISGHQRLTKQQILSVFIVATGLYFLTNGEGSKEAFNIGDLITFIGAVICAVQIISAGYYVRKTEFLGLIFYQFLFSGIISLIGLCLVLIGTQKPLFFEETAVNGVIYLGVLGTLFCFFVTVWAQKYVSTIFTAMIFSLEPVFAAISGYVYSGELFTSVELYGALGILSGLVIYNIPAKKVSKEL